MTAPEAALRLLALVKDSTESQMLTCFAEELKVPYELEIFHRNPQTHLAGPGKQASIFSSGP
jgi:hypothetical protein